MNTKADYSDGTLNKSADLAQQAQNEKRGKATFGLGSRIAAWFSEVGLKPGEELERPELGYPRDLFATNARRDRHRA